MKLLTWNCNGAFRKKYKSLIDFEFDIMIIQECENPIDSNDNEYKKWASNYLWVGDIKHKGLGIFARENIELKNNFWDSSGNKYFISSKINNSFNILGVWNHGANSPTFGYIGQFWKYLQINKVNMIKDDIIIAGDFNSNKIWDKWDRWWNHSDVIRELEEINIKSFYHHLNSEEQGKESASTFYLHKDIKKNYHIDYVLGSKRFHENIILYEIGKSEKWLELSDHMPIIIKII